MRLAFNVEENAEQWHMEIYNCSTSVENHEAVSYKILNTATLWSINSIPMDLPKINKSMSPKILIHDYSWKSYS